LPPTKPALQRIRARKNGRRLPVGRRKEDISAQLFFPPLRIRKQSNETTIECVPNFFEGEIAAKVDHRCADEQRAVYVARPGK